MATIQQVAATWTPPDHFLPFMLSMPSMVNPPPSLLKTRRLTFNSPVFNSCSIHALHALHGEFSPALFFIFLIS